MKENSMTKKEFITNILREAGYEVKKYTTGYTGAVVYVGVDSEDKRGFTVFTDVDLHNPERHTVRFKYRYPYINFTEAEAIELERKFNLYLRTRGFNAVAKRYKGLVGDHKSEKDTHWIVQVISKGQFPWEECAKHMSNDEAIEDALNSQARYKPAGNVLEVSTPSIIAISEEDIESFFGDSLF